MKQSITRYERELFDLLLRQAALASQQLDMIHRAAELLMLVDEGDNAVHFGNWINSIADGGDGSGDLDQQLTTMLDELGVTVLDPLTEDKAHGEEN
ncbi:MAG: hypothetical protein AB7I57_24345 [Pirellulales bacterium]